MCVCSVHYVIQDQRPENRQTDGLMPGMTNNNNRCCFPADFISMWNDARKKKVATKVKQTPPTGLAGSTEGGDTESISPGEQQSTGIPTLPQRCAIQRNVRLFTGLKDRSFPASPPDNGSSGSSQTQGTFLSNQFVKDKVYKKKKKVTKDTGRTWATMRTFQKWEQWWQSHRKHVESRGRN